LAPVLRVYLTGDPCVLTPDRLIRAERLPGRQGRLAFAYLVSQRARPVPRDEFAETLWPDGPPASHELALSALISKLRALLVEAGLERPALRATDGCYRLELPAGTWVDTEAAHEALHEAEAALRARDHAGAYAPAAVASAVLRRPFLPGAEGEWVERRRDALRQLLVRALDVLAEVHAWNREPAMALRVAEQAVALEPYRESGYRRLMELHHRAGDRAQALRVYERCRRLLADELGAAPAPETEAARRALLPSSAGRVRSAP
jgi:SARP family transcriptional regulator, regulator of embCAB operon